MNNFSQDFFSKEYFFGKKNSNYYNYNWWDSNRYWKSTIKTVKKYEMGGKVLDVGCAFGFLLKRLQPYFDEIHGIDISDFSIQRAQKEVTSAQLKKINLDNQELPYLDEYFDLITAFDVLEHTKSTGESTRKIIKKLKRNGYLIISVPLKDTLAGKIFNIFDKDQSHVSILSKKELFDILEKGELKILEKSYFLNMVFFKLKNVAVNIELVLQKNN